MKLLFGAACALAAAAAGAGAGAAPKVWPSGPGVPENLLRIELEFASALAAPLDMASVALLDQAGRPISDAFLDLPLPSRDGKRLTILLHPGRIKTGVGPNLAIGMALHQGATVTLSITDPQLRAPLKKTWLVEPALRRPIDPAAWRLAAPAVGGRAPLALAFPGALDAGAADLIAVAAPDGSRVAGRATLARHERGWRFVPEQPWRPGLYGLRVHPSLEDPEGNRICSSFEQVAQSALACDSDFQIPFTLTLRQPIAKKGR